MKKYAAEGKKKKREKLKENTAKKIMHIWEKIWRSIVILQFCVRGGLFDYNNCGVGYKCTGAACRKKYKDIWVEGDDSII